MVDSLLRNMTSFLIWIDEYHPGRDRMLMVIYAAAKSVLLSSVIFQKSSSPITNIDNFNDETRLTFKVSLILKLTDHYEQ